MRRRKQKPSIGIAMRTMIGQMATLTYNNILTIKSSKQNENEKH
jgi:hypothetical protein